MLCGSLDERGVWWRMDTCLCMGEFHCCPPEIITTLLIGHSVQFSHAVMSDSLWPPWTAAHQDSLSITNPQSLLKLMSIESVMPSNYLIHVIPFSSHLQSFPASGSFPMSQCFTSDGQSIGVPASASVFPMNIQDWFPLGWTDLISLQSKGLFKSLLQHHSSKASILQLSAFFIVQLSHPYNGPLLAKQCLCFLIRYLGWSYCLGKCH